MNGETMIRMKVGESIGKLIIPNIEKELAQITPKGDLESIILTAKFAAENAIKNIYTLIPWLKSSVIGDYKINYNVDKYSITSHVTLSATSSPEIIATAANIVSLITLLDMYKSINKNVYIADIITSGENFSVKEIQIKQLPIEKVYIEAKEGDTFPITMSANASNSIVIKSIIIKEYDYLIIGDIYFEIIPAPSGTHVAKALNSGSATITDTAFLIRRIKK